MEETEVGHRSRSKYLPNVPVIWVEDITFVPQGEALNHSYGMVMFTDLHLPQTTAKLHS